MTNKYAFLLGISNYDNFSSHKFPDLYIKDFYDLLSESGHYNENSIICMRTDSEPKLQPKINRIKFLYKYFIEEILDKRKRCQIIIYFICHGGSVGNFNYIFPMDVEPDYLEGTSIKLDWFIKEITPLNQNWDILFIIDACRVEMKKGLALKKIDAFTDEIIDRSYPAGINVFYACAPRESSVVIKSEEGDDFSIFSRALLEGLKYDLKGPISNEKLSIYVNDKIYKIATSHHEHVQEPFFRAEDINKGRKKVFFVCEGETDDIGKQEEEERKKKIKNHQIQEQVNFHSDDARFYTKIGKLKQALKCYDKIIDIAPEDEFAWANKGLILSKLYSYEEAMISCDKALMINPNHCMAWINKGIIFQHTGNYQEALGCFDKALKINPNFKYAWYNKASIESLRNNPAKSVDYLKKTFELDINYVEYVKKDKDFDNIRKSKEFKNLLKPKKKKPVISKPAYIKEIEDEPISHIAVYTQRTWTHWMSQYDFVNLFEQKKGQTHPEYPTKMEGRYFNGAQQFRGIYHRLPPEVAVFYSYIQLNDDQFFIENINLITKGARLICHQTFFDENLKLNFHQATWIMEGY